MARRLRRHLPGHATVAAYLALFIALTGGAAWAAGLAKNSVKSKQIAPNAVKGSDVLESSLGEVPSADKANSATSAKSATTAQNANSAQSASTAANAGTVDGVDSTAFARKDQIAAFTLVGLPDVLPNCVSGGGGTGDTWADQSPNVNESASYQRDQLGVVHLIGTVRRCNAATTNIFTLPAGFRPALLQHFSVAAEGDTPPTTIVTVASNGIVDAADSAQNDTRSLDGISFRCAPSGANGCP